MPPSSNPDSTPNATPAPGAPNDHAGGNFRWVICSLLFFSVALNYIDRTILSILKDPLSLAFNWSEGDFSSILAANQIAYALGYLFCGRLMDKIGIKRGLPLAVLVWSIASAAHGLCSLIAPAAGIDFQITWHATADKAAVWALIVMPASVLGFMAARVVLGIAQGGNFPAAIKCIAEWFPQKERALATGLFNAGTNVGAIICMIGVPFLLNNMVGPETAAIMETAVKAKTTIATENALVIKNALVLIFYGTGALGVLWLIAWRFLYEVPERHARLGASERAYIVNGQPKAANNATPQPPQTQQQKISWLSLFKYRPVWAYVIAGILAGPAWNFYQNYLPDCLKTQFKLSLQAAGNWTALFYLIAIFGGIAVGWLAGYFLNKGWDINKARKLSMLICALAVVPMFITPHLPAVWLAVIIIGIAGSAHQGWSANLFSFVSDTMPKQTIGAVVGLGGFVTYFTGGVVAKIIGQIKVLTGSYDLVFISYALMYLISLLIIQLLVPRIKQVA